jgi:KRAB domain-containing zinc finger protein
LADHKRKHIKQYKCNICEKTFARKDKLTNHKRTYTEERPFIYVIFVISPTLAVGTDHKKIHTNEMQYECDICKTTFNKSTHFARHKRNLQSEYPGCLTQKKLYKCDVCVKTFARNDNLTTYKRNHTR